MSENDPIHSASMRVVRPDNPQDGPDGASNLLPVGTRLGEFELTGVIGEGGFGIVYAAYDHLLEREVAIKEYMPSALASRLQGSQVGVKSERHAETFESGRRSFINEAKLLAQFDHAALVKVYRFWEANGTAYMVMPYYRGITLTHALRNLGGPPSELWMRQLLWPLFEALETIHEQHCYHRDIAPDNILILPNGKPLLLDFGAARRVIGDMTQALTVILKPGFAPVEQYANDPGMKQGPWTDVYALAAVIYYCMTGKPPMPSVSRMMRDTLAPAREIGQGRYSARFLDAVDHALTVNAEQRTASIPQFRTEMGGSHDATDAGASPMPAGVLSPDPTAVPATATPIAAHRVEDTERTRPLGADFSPDAVLPMPRTSAPVGKPGVTTAERAAGSAGAAAAAGSAGGGRGRMLAIAAIAALALAGGGAWLALSGGPREDSVRPAQPGQGGATTTTGTAPVGAPDTSASTPAPGAVQPAPSPGQAAANAPKPVFATTSALDDLHALRDTGWEVGVRTESPEVRIGVGQLRFELSSERAGHVYLLMVGTDRQHLYQLFPNAIDASNRIQAGGTLKLPRPSWSMVAGGPPGVNRFIALVTPSPRDFSSAGLRKGNPFSEFDIDATRRAFDTGGPGVLAGKPLKCDLPPDACARFGSVLFDLREVE